MSVTAATRLLYTPLFPKLQGVQVLLTVIVLSENFCVLLHHWIVDEGNIGLVVSLTFLLKRSRLLFVLVIDFTLGRFFYLILLFYLLMNLMSYWLLNLFDFLFPLLIEWCLQLLTVLGYLGINTTSRLNLLHYKFLRIVAFLDHWL